MEVNSTLRFARISPLKVTDLAREIRGKPVAKALQVLQFSHRKGAFLLLKTLKSAVGQSGGQGGCGRDRTVDEALQAEGTWYGRTYSQEDEPYPDSPG